MEKLWKKKKFPMSNKLKKKSIKLKNEITNNYAHQCYNQFVGKLIRYVCMLFKYQLLVHHKCGLFKL
jgi:ribosomal 50S subunit-associated protein YjgA (DUF615 family)